MVSREPRAALVTGGASGIGAGIVARLARDGLEVGVLDLDAAAAQRQAETVVESGGRARGLGCDVADEESVATAVASFVGAVGRIDVLVNNAGIITSEKPIHEVTGTEFDRLLAVNLRGPFLMARAVVPHMEAAGGGRIVNVASRSWLGGRGIGAYAASKGGVLSLTRSLALELGALGITCNAVSPSLVDTPLFRGMEPAEQEADLRKAALNPVPRIGRVEDIAHAVSFFCAEEAGFVTGQHVYVSGGADLLTSGIGT